jgi:hypothetical protein
VAVEGRFEERAAAWHADSSSAVRLARTASDLMVLRKENKTRGKTARDRRKCAIL